MAQCLFRSFPNNVTRVAISSYKNVDYDVKPAKMRFTSHENLLVHPLLLPVSSQREQTIVYSEEHLLWPAMIYMYVKALSNWTSNIYTCNYKHSYNYAYACTCIIHNYMYIRLRHCISEHINIIHMDTSTQ